jgi:TPR repeat protein
VKNEAEAARYYKLAADQNDADVQYDSVVCLPNRGGVVKDEVKAARYYRAFHPDMSISISAE